MTSRLRHDQQPQSEARSQVTRRQFTPCHSPHSQPFRSRLAISAQGIFRPSTDEASPLLDTVTLHRNGSFLTDWLRHFLSRLHPPWHQKTSSAQPKHRPFFMLGLTSHYLTSEPILASSLRHCDLVRSSTNGPLSTICEARTDGSSQSFTGVSAPLRPSVYRVSYEVDLAQLNLFKTGLTTPRLTLSEAL